MMALSLIAVLAASMVVIQMSGANEQRGARQEDRAVLAAEAGLSQAYMRLQAGASGVIGSANAPADLAGGDVFVTTQTFGPTNNLVRVTSSASLGNSSAGAELVLRDNMDTMFRYGAFGDSTLGLESQAKVDSYDSTVGTYLSQMVNGSGSNTWANSHGQIGSNGNIHGKQNAAVYGDATPGVSGSVTLVGTAMVTGSTAPSTNPFVFPPITVPSIPSLGDKTFLANTSLPSGSYHYGAGVTATDVVLTVAGPATIVFDALTMSSRSQIRVDSTNGPVDIYVINDFIMSSNTMMASLDFDPRDLRLKLLSDNIINPGIIVDLDDVIFDSNAKFYGSMYAPDAYINIDSNFEVFGALVAERVRLASNSRVHYDESLARVLPVGMEHFSRLSWRVVH